VIWGRPEVPKLFASSHNSIKLLKNHPVSLKKAISLARWEQDPMNEVLNLWSPITSEN
jgi:transcriptional accessory protein Tex/SPT6